MSSFQPRCTIQIHDLDNLFSPYTSLAICQTSRLHGSTRGHPKLLLATLVRIPLLLTRYKGRHFVALLCFLCRDHSILSRANILSTTLVLRRAVPEMGTHHAGVVMTLSLMVVKPPSCDVEVPRARCERPTSDGSLRWTVAVPLCLCLGPSSAGWGGGRVGGACEFGESPATLGKCGRCGKWPLCWRWSCYFLWPRSSSLCLRNSRRKSESVFDGGWKTFWARCPW